MERDELLEWLGLILAILIWWPALFGWFPLAYEIVVWVFSGVVVSLVLVRRLRRVREGLRYSREIMDAQRQVPPGYPPGTGPVRPLSPDKDTGERGRHPPGNAAGDDQ